MEPGENEEKIEGEEMENEEETTEPVKEEVVAAVEACFEEGGEAYELDKNAAIDAVIKKLEALKGEEGPKLGGLGDTGEPMDLGEAE